jgi:ABC-type Fe3+ transport system substrate-binding protein
MLLAASVIALGGCRKAEESPPSAAATAQDLLVLYSPHSDEIREEFTWGFQAWYQKETGRTVDVQWPDAGGTSQMVKRLQDKFRAGRYDIDLAFGGGGGIFEQMKQLGMLEPYRLPEDLLRRIPKEVAGQALYDADFCWYGAALSTFGLLYNKNVLGDRGLPAVTDWAAMADPRFIGLVGPGDPSKSGSVRKVYEIILEAYGYERGMSLLIRMGGNAREFYDQASEIPRACALGTIALGPCIDFYADRQMHSDGGRAIGFVAPEGMTVLNADPIAMFKNAPHRKVAEKFLEFVMSPAGQGLWMVPPGAQGGPRTFSLDRMAVLPEVFELPAVKARGGTPPPFALAPAKFFDAAKETARIAILPDYLRVAAIENQEPLKRAWRAIIAASLPDDLVGKLVQPLVTEDEMTRLGREVWQPVRVAKDATPDEVLQSKQKEEMRLRSKSEIEKQWRSTLKQRYEALAVEAETRAARR